MAEETIKLGQPMHKRQFHKVHVVANPAAGEDEPVLAKLNRIFREHDIAWDLSITQAFGDGERLTRQALQNGADLVIAYGGDGTVMDVANGVYLTDKPMTIISGGTGNAAAGALGIPADLETAVTNIATGRGIIKPIDAGKIGDRIFVLRADMGDPIKIFQEVNADAKEQFGVLAYYWAVLRAVPDTDDIQYKLTIDGATHNVRAAACILANLNNIGTFNFRFGNGIVPDDGLIDVFLLRSNLRSVTSLFAALNNIGDFSEFFEHHRGKHIRIETQYPVPALVDGEPAGETPLVVEILHKAIRLFVPPK